VDEFRTVYTKTRKLESGDEIKNEKYQQYYGDLKVEGGNYLIHYKNDTIYSLNGLYLDNINLNQIPKINNKIALERAMQNINAEIYNWEVYDTIYIPEGELLVIKSDTLKNSYHLAYKFIISALKPLSSYLIYVNANDGSIIRMSSLVYNEIPSPGPANTIYSGEQIIYTKWDNSQYKYKLLDPARDIHTYDNQNDEDLNPHEFYDSDNIWTESPVWDNEPGLDAHWAAYITYQYLQNVVGINSYDDIGGKIDLYVHWGVGYEDAGTDVGSRSILLGDGGTECGTSPFASLDIVTHEIGHLVSYYAGLEAGVQTSESRAIVEAFSDIWAICVEWDYVNNIETDPNKEPYNTAEEICISADFGRSSSNPKSLGLCGFRGADTYQRTYWDFEPPYSMSTVISHWFYIFNEGKVGTNDLGNDFIVEGINDPLEGSKILYKACDEYLEGYESFQNVKEQTINLLQTDKGELDPITLNAIQAWYAVGVPGSCLTQCWNKTYSSDFNLYVPGCNLNVDNVNITGTGTDVIFEADEITIESDFEVDSGTTLEIINP
jgi:Zn-dependent metalloprotease